MHTDLKIKPTDRLIKSYYETLEQYGQLHIDHEMAVRSAFQDILAGYARKIEWMLVPEFQVEGKKKNRVIVDGAVLDSWRQRRGYWEAKDEHDDLEKEIRSKIDKGYPTSNMIFQAPERAVLYQHGIRQGLNEDITDRKNLVELLHEFFLYREPDHEEWESAVSEFKDRLPEIARRAEQLIEAERKNNKEFIRRFEDFYALCRGSINPNLSAEAVEKMLVQHLLTERIFRRVFHNEEFRTRNVIASEIEKVIASLTSRHFSRDAFLSDLDRFYKAIERSADDKSDYSEKQDFLNTVYERFFQGYSPKEADTHGIVYTPQPIVDFMVGSVEEILKKEFGKSLSDKGVHILDPFVGTGNFITRIMREIKKTALPYKYENELHCNEVMLLPYYIASMNIAHQYYEQTGEYKEFPGICLVDTFELAESEQSGLGFMTEENTERVKRQKESPIFVFIANPPYNANQLNENDNNKNRKYKLLDTRVSETYARASSATLLNKLNDPYVKALRWATDRTEGEKVIAFVTNRSFVHKRAFDGVRHHLRSEFDHIYILDLGGDVRDNPKLSGTTHNVFGIKPGVSISLFIRKTPAGRECEAEIYYSRTDEYWRREKKLNFLREKGSYLEVEFRQFESAGDDWLAPPLETSDWQTLTSLGSKKREPAIFHCYSLGLSTNRDSAVYGSSKEELTNRISRFIEYYNSEVFRYQHAGKPKNVDGFLKYDRIKWSRNLKRHMRNGDTAQFSKAALTVAQYRPFMRRFLYLADILVDEPAKTETMFHDASDVNIVICVSGVASQKPFQSLTVSAAPSLDLLEKTQCFAFYTYDEDGSNRRENITDWALNEFRSHYKDKKITKWDIFYYVYGVLHSPEYRTRYAANLKRELPRIPFVCCHPEAASSADEGSGRADSRRGAKGAHPNPADLFWQFAKAGQRLADLHVNYEKQPEYPLERMENPNQKLNWRVEKMRLNKDKTTLTYNSFLTLKGIPLETYEYRLGNRSALEWVIDQYQVSTDKRSGITNDPNRADDPEYILRLIGQVIYVSLETVKIVKALPELGLEAAKAATTDQS